jgi:hypothetical protein
MNKWDCDHDGCTTTAVGTGGAIGLLAIGWYFVAGTWGRSGQLLCPAHRPDPIPCADDSRDDDGNYRTFGKPCSDCKADEIADVIQHAIAHHYDQLVAWDAERRLAGKRVWERST